MSCKCAIRFHNFISIPGVKYNGIIQIRGGQFSWIANAFKVRVDVIRGLVRGVGGGR